MTWLIRLYPPAWRRRYGPELAELLATQPASFGTAIDLVAGAVDAWINPQSTASRAGAAADAKGAGEMIPRMLQLRCAGHGPTITRADSVKAAAVTIGGTLVLVFALTWAMARFGTTPYLEALLAISWLVPFAFSQRYTSLKERPGLVQAVVIGGQAAIASALVLGAVWLNNN